MQSVKVAVLGLGTVGSGTVNVLNRNLTEITRRAGRNIEISRAADRNISDITSCNTDNIDLNNRCNEYC